MVIAGMLACAMLVAWLFSVFMEMPFWPLAVFFSICALIGIVREKLLVARERQRR